MKDKLIIITGPTASGKSFFAMELAKKLDAEIISSDSQQIYKEMDIGTNKISKEEQAEITHHMLDIIKPNDEFSVQDFSNSSKKIIKEINLKKKMAIIAGGTGFYIDSILFEMNYGKVSKDFSIRNKYINLAKEKDKVYLHSLLKNIDPLTASKYHYNETNRIIRALEIYEISGKKPSELRSGKDEINKTIKPLLFYINYRDRSKLYDKINSRVISMINEGLLDEFLYLKNKYNLTKESQSMKAIGYKEIFDYYDNNLTKEELIDLIQKNTRHYAKRQITWMKKYSNYDFSKSYYLDEKKEEDILKDMLGVIKKQYGN